MEVKCPHCGKDISLVGAKELRNDFNIGANKVQHERERGRFPSPYLSFGNRKVYLRSDIEAYRDEQERAKAEGQLAGIAGNLESLPKETRESLLKLLSESLKS